MTTKQIVEADGFKWAVGGADTDDHLALGGHEPGLRPIFESLCDPTKLFVNVGAHVGLWALRMAPHAYHVLALEANVNTYRRLQENVELNDLRHKITPYYAAIWDRNNELVTLVDENGKESGGSTRVEIATSPTSQLTVTLDTLLDAQHSLETALGAPPVPVGFISMDIEGAEAKALRGAKNLILRDRPNLLIELHDGHPGTDPDLRQQVYDLLTEYDYEWDSLFLAPPGEHLRCFPAEIGNQLPEFPEVVKAGE